MSTTTSHAGASLGHRLAEQLGIEILGHEGHDLKVACPSPVCSSSDAGRIHQTKGTAFCFSCGQSWSPFSLSESLLGDRKKAVELMVQLGVFDAKTKPSCKPKNEHKHGSQVKMPSTSKAKKSAATKSGPLKVSDTTAATECMPCFDWAGKLLFDPIERVATAKGITKAGLLAFGARAILGTSEVLVPSFAPDLTPRREFAMTPLGKGRWPRRWYDGERVAGIFMPIGHEEQPLKPSTDQTWVVAEGVKDCAALHCLGYLAAGLPTNRMAEEFAPLFSGVHVVLMPDRDCPGVTGARASFERLLGFAASIRVAELPLPLQKSKGADTRDALKLPNGEQLVRDAIENATLASDYFASSHLIAEIESLGGTLDGGSGADDSDDPDEDQSSETSLQITNFDLEPDDEGELKPVPLDMASVLERFSVATGGWPKRLGGSLFVTSGEHVQWLASPASLFGWAGSTTGNVVDWKRGPAFASKEETFAELCRTAESFDAIESLPHAPPLPRHYYTHPPLTPGCGSRLSELIDRFNPETVVDRDLILSMFITLIWGGQGGTRPAFVITSDQGRGAGKSKLVAMLSLLAGGSVDLSQAEDIGKIKERLLSPEGLARRVVLIDNVKSHRWSWSDLEGLITAPTISGKRLYVGESMRPNSLLWCVTLNGVSLSTDLAQRAVVIKLASPPRTPGWEDQTRALINSHRSEILSDLVGFFEQEPQPLENLTRWSSWEHDVIARLPEPTEALKIIKERRATADVEREEADLIEDYFRSQLSDLHYDVDADVVHLPAIVAATWLSAATGDKMKTAAATRQLKQLHDEGRLTTIVPNPCRTHGRGVLWWGVKADGDAVTRYDIETRIASRSSNKFFN